MYPLGLSAYLSTSFPLLCQFYLLQDGDESYESSDVDHDDNDSESDDDYEKIVIISGSSKWCFFLN